MLLRTAHVIVFFPEIAIDSFLQTFLPVTVATSPVAMGWLCDSSRTGCVRRTKIYVWREQAIIEWSRRVISIVACCHGAKLCAYAARDFRSQHYQSLEILTLAQMLWTARVGVCCRTVSATTKTKNLHLLGRRLCEQPKLMYTYNSFHNSLAPKVNCISCRVLNSTWVPCRRGSNSVLWTCF